MPHAKQRSEYNSQTKDHLVLSDTCLITVVSVLPPPAVPITERSHSWFLIKKPGL